MDVRGKLIAYKCLAYKSPDILQAEISGYIEKGWELHGETRHTGNYYFQPIVKFEQEEE